MKTRKSLLTACIIVLGILPTGSARADIRPPEEQRAGKPSVPIDVTFDATKDVSVLKIGREAWRQAAAPVQGQRTHWSPSDFRSIVAAVVLSLGIAGVFLLRGRRGLAAGVAVVVGVIVATAAVQAWGNAPPAFNQDLDVPFRMGGDGGFHGRVVIEVVDEPANRVSLVAGTKLTVERAPQPNQTNRQPAAPQQPAPQQRGR